MSEEGSSGGAGSGWKSRFPVARIKKIMQADEDVGKVAQVTPVAISKALELFMDRIIKAVADETKARGARKVTPSHFKQVITTQGQYDFLEGLTAEFTLPPSRPATPPPSTPHPRRRRKVSPSSTDAPPADPPVKRKRRSPVKQERVTAEEETVQKDSITETQVRGEHKRGGWFDIVMGSHEAESESEDDSQRKRKYRLKKEEDEDGDYMP